MAGMTPNDDGEAPWYDRETPEQVLRRIKRFALSGYVVLAVFSLIYGGFRGFLGLTYAAAVTMISFLWLQEIAEILLQPVPQKKYPWKLIVRTLARFALLGVALTITIIVARFNAVSVVLGFSIIVIGIFGEALYGLYRSIAG